MTVAAVVLAAGASSRFQGPTHKLLTVVNGRRLVDWAVAHAADAALDDLIVVTGALDLDLPGRLHNGRWQEGLSTSLRLAVDEAERRGHDAVVVGLGDQPGIPPSAWRTVAASTHKPVVIGVYGGGRRGHPVRLAAEVWPLLPTEGDAGANVVLYGRPELVGEVACEGDPHDVDTLEDLHRWS